MDHNIFFSDLHLLSRRSEGLKYQREIFQKTKRARTVVLGGDIFDFKWSEGKTFEQSIDWSIEWLRRLMVNAADAKFYYLLGNHDAHPDFLKALDRLSLEAKNQFEWMAHWLKLNNTVFLHGDVLDANNCHQRLDEKRRVLSHQQISAPIVHKLYDVAIKAKLHRAVIGIAARPARVLPALTKYLSQQQMSFEQGVEHVYFGHTHRPLDESRYQNACFHNGGASISGLSFRIIDFQLPE